MGDVIHEYYNYPNGRDIVFVFGAGASYADGAPLQGEILPIIMSGELRDIEESDTGKNVLEFVKDNYANLKRPTSLPYSPAKAPPSL